MKTTLLIFGITGDLSRRKLLPALRDIVQSGECEPLSIIGVSRREVDVQDLVTAATGDDTLVDRTSVITMDVAHLGDYQRLTSFLPGEGEQLVIYLSVPPGAAADIVDFLGKAGINTPGVKIMFEKPFGYDEQSARDYINRTARYFNEDQIYRIDHYMAKEVAQELIAAQLESKSIKKITVAATETLGVEGRGDFYEQTGALRDVVQGHLMQLLSLVLMDSSQASLPVRRQEALSLLKPAQPERSLRGQYAGYADAVGNPGSKVETFVRIGLESSDPRWHGVGIELVTGKSLDKKYTGIDIDYIDGSHRSFVEHGKSPDGRLKDGYERIIVSALKGDKDVFTTSPEIIRAWQLLAEVQRAWDMDATPLVPYKPDSSVESIN